jgi:diguanylate cyclase (GGDEF)-like protein
MTPFSSVAVAAEPTPGHRRRPPLPPLGLGYAAAVITAAAIVLLTPIANTRFGWWFDDVGDLVVAAVAAACCGWRAVRSRGRSRLVWLVVSLACASWAAGEAAWCWFELIRGIDPFPSVADIGYLGFPVLVCVALMLYPAGDGTTGKRRRALDTAMTISAMALISWETVLGAVAKTSTDGSTLTDALSLAYPVTDLAVLVLTVLTLARARGGRWSLGLMAAGVVALSFSDSLFGYLTAVSSYSGGAVDLGWFAAFLLLTLAPLAGRSGSRDPNDAHGDRRPLRPALLTYAPLTAALVVTVVLAATGHRPSDGQLLLATAVVAILLVRQYLTARENARLANDLANREAELRHQAFHDSLTGLANRALFHDRLAHALALHGRDLRSISVLFLDLDDFKVINDTLGHLAGDELLTRVAERVTGAVRTGDTVARLGGDEFAVLQEDQGDPAFLAEKLTDAVRRPFTIAAQQVAVTVSIGVVVLGAGDVATTADELVRLADIAMYTAKRRGKGRVEWYRDGMSIVELAGDAPA